MKRLVGIAAIVIAFAGIATAKSPKHEYGAAANENGPGYMSAPTEGGRYAVVYTGARGMKRDEVAQLALLRAAELTAESGKEWFAVINTKSQRVALVEPDGGLKNRSGGFMGGPGGASAGSGGGNTSSPRGVSDASTAGGASTGGFGGGAPPPQVVERWTPPKVYQTIIVIQMGSGEEAKFTGVEKAPEIFSAKTVAEEIRAKIQP